MVSNKKNIIFDFDGVLADTSLIKSDVFKKFFLKFSQGQKILDYQIKNKGISRYQILDKLYELEDINVAISSIRTGKSAGRVLIKL